MLKTKGSWYPRDVIVQAVYLKPRLSLSYRDIEEILIVVPQFHSLTIHDLQLGVGEPGLHHIAV
jgi:transposase-like protein